MFLFDFQRFLKVTSAADLQDFEDGYRSLLEQRKFRDACNFFVHHVPLTAPALFDESYFEAAALYNLAMISAHLGRSAEASILMTKSGVTSAGDWQDLPFSEHQRLAEVMRARQREAIQGGRPGILLTSLPKAASAFVSQMVSEYLNLPVLRASIGLFPNNAVVRGWAAEIAGGGCTTHDHFDGRDSNVEQLVAAGIRSVHVQIRDPRAAMVSAFHFGNRFGERPLETLHSLFFLPAVSWIDSWIRVEREGRLAVHFVDFNDVRERPGTVLETICRRVGLTDAATGAEEFVARRGGHQPANFRSGTQDDWRDQIPEPLQEEMWGQISPSVKALLCLVP